MPTTRKRRKEPRDTAPLPEAPSADDKTELERAVEFVASHPVTLRLKALGVTEEQLAYTNFQTRKQPGQFDYWSFRAGYIEPMDAFMLAKAYCTLKWLIIENPPGSPDKDAGWRLLREIEIAPLVASARLAQQRHVDMTLRGIAARTKYTAKERAAWIELAATDPNIAAKSSKSHQAALIAERRGLPKSAEQTIRKVLSKSV